MGISVIEDRKARARGWFEALRDDICAALERLEDDAPAPLYRGDAGRFARTPWNRTDHTGQPGGGRDVGNARTSVRESRRALLDGAWRVQPGISRADSRRCRRSALLGVGVSVIAHMRNPHIPAVHMNTRFVVTTKAWFGGGSDLTPVLDRRRTQDDADTVAFHAAMRAACGGANGVADYDRYKKWCDDYFYLPHRKEAAASVAFFTITMIPATGMPTLPSPRMSAARF